MQKAVSTVVYPHPLCVPLQDVIANCHRIAKTMDGAKLGYPGLDLVGGAQDQLLPMCAKIPVA